MPSPSPSPSRYSCDSEDLLSEIDKFLEEFDSDGEEIPEKDKIGYKNVKVKSNDFNAANSVVNDITSSEPNEVEFVSKNQAVFHILEDHENFGVYDHNPGQCNWDVFYRTFHSEEQKCFVKQEPKTFEDNTTSKDNTTTKNKESSFILPSEKNSRNTNNNLPLSNAISGYQVIDNMNTYEKPEKSKNEKMSIPNPEYVEIKDRKSYKDKKTSNNTHESKQFHTNAEHSIPRDNDLDRNHKKHKNSNENVSLFIHEICKTQENHKKANETFSFSDTRLNYPVEQNFEKLNANTYYPLVQDHEVNGKQVNEITNANLLLFNTNSDFPLVNNFDVSRTYNKNTNELIANPDYTIVQDMDVSREQMNKKTDDSLSFLFTNSDYHFENDIDISRNNEKTYDPIANPNCNVVQSSEVCRTQENKKTDDNLPLFYTNADYSYSFVDEYGNSRVNENFLKNYLSSVNTENHLVQDHETYINKKNNLDFNKKMNDSLPFFITDSDCSFLNDNDIFQNNENSNELNASTDCPLLQDHELYRKPENKKTNDDLLFFNTNTDCSFLNDYGVSQNDMNSQIINVHNANPKYPGLSDYENFKNPKVLNGYNISQNYKESQDTNELNANFNYPVLLDHATLNKSEVLNGYSVSQNYKESQNVNDLIANPKYPGSSDYETFRKPNFSNEYDVSQNYKEFQNINELNANPNYPVLLDHETFKKPELLNGYSVSQNYKNVNEPNVNPKCPVLPDYETFSKQENPAIKHCDINKKHKKAKKMKKNLSLSCGSSKNILPQDKKACRKKKNSENTNEDISFSNTKDVLQDDENCSDQEEAMDTTESLVSFPLFSTKYNVSRKYDDDNDGKNDDDHWANEISTKNRKWKPFDKQFQTYSKNIPPQQNKRNYHKNYDHSNRWQQRRNTFTTPLRNNSFNKSFKSNCYDQSSYANYNNFNNSNLPTRHTRNYVNNSNNYYNKNSRFMQGKNQYGPRMPYSKNNNSYDLLPKQNYSTSSNLNIPIPYIPTNIGQPNNNNFKVPAQPIVSKNVSSYLNTREFNVPYTPKPLTTKLPKQNEEVYKSAFYEITTWEPSKSNVDLKSVDSQTLAVDPRSLYNSKNKSLQGTEKVIDVHPNNDKKSKDDHGKNQGYGKKINPYDDHYAEEQGEIQSERHNAVKDTFLHVTKETSVVVTPDKNESVCSKKRTELFNNELREPGIIFDVQHVIKDYLSPVSLVGSTVKFTSRKLANTSIREEIIEACSSHGEIENSWWTPDDLLYVCFVERSVAIHVFKLYPKNLTSSY